MFALFNLGLMATADILDAECTPLFGIVMENFTANLSSLTFALLLTDMLAQYVALRAHLLHFLSLNFQIRAGSVSIKVVFSSIKLGILGIFARPLSLAGVWCLVFG